MPKVGRPETRTIPGEYGRAWSWPSAYLWHTDGRTLRPVNTLQLQFLISILAGWVNRGQQNLIEYLQADDLTPIAIPVPMLEQARCPV